MRGPFAQQGPRPIEGHDAMRVRVGHDEASIAFVEPPGLFEKSSPTSSPPPRESEASLRGELLDAAVPLIADVETPVAIDSHVNRSVEGAVVEAVAPDEKEKGSVALKHLDAVVPGVGDIDSAVGDGES